ncbi:hypothetical protein [Micromonospora sp. NPDC126480]|uniref:hypothetical protein n=1 Tax=Micromonospora sp. NPDC126480 TaxID=3155312 RepID=UPI0033207713
MTGGSETRLPTIAFGSAAVTSYDRFCWTFTAYSSWIFSRVARVLPMAWVAAASAV